MIENYSIIDLIAPLREMKYERDKRIKCCCVDLTCTLGHSQGIFIRIRVHVFDFIKKCL